MMIDDDVDHGVDDDDNGDNNYDYYYQSTKTFCFTRDVKGLLSLKLFIKTVIYPAGNCY